MAELHALDPFADGPIDEPQVWWCDFADAALVLGSRQDPSMLDGEAARRDGLSIVRRRSGGGAVLLRPDDACWIDVVAPHGTVPDDVHASMVAVGERWIRALHPLIDGRAVAVHREGLTGSAWSELICFVGTGPGEVLLDGEKLVGLSQRRTRHGIRVQGLVHRRPVDLTETAQRVGAPAIDVPGVAWIDGLATDVDVESLAGRLERTLG